MPAPVLSQSSTRTAAKVATQKPRATDAPPKKRRVVRRRGRARGELESDDEIEREAATDSDSDDGDLSSLDSATDDSDTEPASEDVIPRDRAHLPTPRNSKSPETVAKEEEPNVGGVPSFFAPAGDWSEMVADEKVNGPADLPVIEFADFSGHPVSQNVPPRKPKKASKLKRSSESRATPADSTHEATPPVDESAPSRPEPHPNRVSSQSARQAYQHKLETDPSFVPTIGNFWGHDDRLIDTELRSLSGWWRGRGRGRGRGFGMRGRGGFQGPESRGQGGEDAMSPKEEDLPPIERAWTHDGFEELKRKEEQRRAEHLTARNTQLSPKRGGFVASRGGFVTGRGRGGFARVGFASPTGTRNTSFSIPGRVRFAMKPELMWTKQHEAFLYFDSNLKPRPGQGPAFRIKIPGHESGLVRAPFAPRAPPQASTSRAGNEGSEAGDKYFVVRLPKRAGKEREVVVNEKAAETPIEEVFTVRPLLASAAKPLPVPEQAPSSTASTVVVAPTQPTVEVHAKVVPEPNIWSQLEQLSLEPQASNPARQAKTEEAVLRNPTTEVALDTEVPDELSTLDRPTLPPLQTTFSPPPPPPSQPISQRSPAYGSPYGYHPQLPMGVALNQHGMPYEVATGHPVYLQPPPMYNPRPLMPSHFSPGIFVPGHMHHPSAVSPDFLAQPPSHTPPMNGFIDPATGTPIFSFPRQTTRIEIRAPTEESGKPKSAPRTSSSLRTTAPTFQPSRASSTTESEYYQQPASADPAGPSYEHANGLQPMEDANQAGMAGMMAYPAYQQPQPYYYPEQYGYPQYVDMSQAGQYDMYNMDQAPQGTVYY